MKPAIVPVTVWVCLALAPIIHGDILHVPKTHPTIQDAIDAAQDGDLILVDPGTYPENIDFLGKAVAVKSTAGPEATILQGSAPAGTEQGSTVTFRNGEGPGSVLQGFRIVNGTGNGFGSFGGGIYCDHASPLIRGNIIEGNHASTFGGGIYLLACCAVVEENTLTGNGADDSGGGIYISGGQPVIRYNTLTDNTASSSPGFGGGLFCEDGAAVVEYNRFQGNLAHVGGGAAFRHSTSVTLTNNLLADNTALFSGGGLYLFQSSPTLSFITVSGNGSATQGGGIYIQESSPVEMKNAILWGDAASWNGPEIHLEGATTLTLTYCDVEGGAAAVSMSPEASLSWGDGMIEEDPLFVNPGMGDFHLAQDPCQPGIVNPAVDGGDPSVNPLLGTTRTDGITDEGTADMGYHYTLAYFLVPLLSMYLLSFVRPAYMNIRHLMMASPPFYLVLGAGLAAIRKKWPLVLAACLALMLAGTAYSTHQYFFNQKYAKDDHRAWGEYLKAHVQPGDVVVVDPPHIAQLYLYYADSGLPWTGLPRLKGSQEATVSALKDLMARYERIWLAFSYTPPWGDPDRLPQRWLKENAFLVDFQNFHSYASLVQTYCFLTEPPVLEDLPRVQHPARVNFEDKLLFLGYDLKGRPPTSGHFLRLNLYWQAQRALTEDYVVSLRLYDDQGHLWGQADRGPLNSHYPTSRWEPGQIVRDDFELFIGVGTPPGPYRLELVVHDGKQALEVWDEEGLAQGRAATIGTVEVGKPASPPSPASLPMTHRRGRDFGGLQLLGYDLVKKDRRAGDWVPVSLYWRAARRLGEDRVLQLRLVDGSGRPWAERAIRPAGDGYPTTLWEEGEVVRGQHALRIPPEAPGGDYRLELAFAGATFDLGTIRVIERERQFAVPPIQHPLRANLGDKVEFLGYDLRQTELRPGEVLPLTLYWRDLQEMDVSYTVFTHLVGEDGRIWGQQDNPPQGGRCPTTLWVEGEVVTDEYRIPLKPEAPPGEYTLEIGLYDARTGKRLPVLDEEGRVLDDKIVLAKIGVSK